MNTDDHLSIETLADYAEGLLDDAEATAAAQHLDACADCRAEQDLLVELGGILAADDPGPMPAEYAARIDATLAELAASEPVTPTQSVESSTTGKGAVVVDLAARRRFAAAGRVTTVAASLVLLIGGAAISVQLLDSSEGGNGAEFGAQPAAPAVLPPVTADLAAAERYALKANNVPTGADAERLPDGSIADKRDGTIYLTDGKVLFTDGTVVVKKKGEQADVSDVRASKVAQNQRAPLVLPGEEPPAPRTPGPAPSPQPTPQPTTQATPAPSAAPSAPAPPAPAATATPTSDPWVSSSGSEYTKTNFARKVQKLLQDSGDVGTEPATEPDPATGPAPDSTSTTTVDQGRASSAAVRGENVDAERGPAPEGTQERVRRCAATYKLGDPLAGDVGTWEEQDVTVVVVQNPDDANGVIGYVIDGNCPKGSTPKAADVLWLQKVVKPAPGQTNPTPAPASPAPSPTPPPASNPPASGGVDTAPAPAPAPAPAVQVPVSAPVVVVPEPATATPAPESAPEQ